MTVLVIEDMRELKRGEDIFQVEIVAQTFEGQTLLDRHRAVKSALKDLFGAEMHALQLKTLSPSEWKK
jgi:BolA protein